MGLLRWPAPGAALCACAAALAFAPGCATSRPPAPAPMRVEPVEARVDVVAGRPLVLPVIPHPGAGEVSARLDDGRYIDASLVWFGISPEPSRPSARAWLPAGARWLVSEPADPDRPPHGQWAVVLDLPPNAIGQGLWLDGRRLALNWLADPWLLAGEHPWTIPGDPERLSSPHLARFAEPTRANPLERWRFRLLMRGLRPRDPGERPREGEAFANSALEALAEQEEARWQVALASLWLADMELAEQVKRRLAATVEFPSPAGIRLVVPAWSADLRELQSLRSDLLNPRMSATQRTERARAWLESQPIATAWVIDDAGQRDAATGALIATCGLANLSERATLAWAALQGAGGARALETLPARAARQLEVRGPGGLRVDPAPVERLVDLNAGGWFLRRTVAIEVFPVRPPGLRIWPLLADWEMLGWMSGRARAAAGPDDAATAGLLYRADPEEGTPDVRWWLYLECHLAPPAPDLPGEERELARVWLGPYARPSAILRITPDGAVVDEWAGQAISGAAITRLADRWLCRLPIPDRLIEPDGILRIGVERTDARGRRSAWPRAMLPWQTEPGRRAVDTGAWGALGER